MKKLLGAVSIVAVVACSGAQAATYNTTFVESGGAVVANGSGSFDLFGMAHTFDGGQEQRIISSLDFFLFGVGNFDAYDLTMTGPTSFGTGGQVIATSSTGDQVGIWADQDRIYVPDGYVSGDALANTATWAGFTFADLGLSVGSFAYLFGNNTYTIDVVGNGPNPVPLPASLPLLLAGLAGFGALRRRKKA